MTDRELLELAAKAAGVPRAAFEHDPMNPDEPYWDPLTDDGDALRLAVKYRLNIYHEPWCVAIGDGRRDLATENLTFGYERAEATRRAIVHAVAEIGRAMP